MTDYILNTHQNPHFHQMTEATSIFAVVSAILFILGAILGVQFSTEEDVFTQSNLQIAVGILVSIMWVASIVAEITMPAYTASVLVHGLMGAVVGYFFSEDGLSIKIGGGEG